ncbi:hypothetical protein NST63_20225 [Heyndrickxia sp. FSL W8-0496]|uniref:hypothetical protein n=1 Tax=Heyndrickxia TaxID=2837504 RepID=UPI0030FC5D7A
MAENNINAHLNNLYKHTSLLIENKGIDNLYGNLDFLGNVLDVILIESIAPQKSKLLRSWINYSDAIFANMIRNDMQLEAIEYMRKYHEINKNHSYKTQLEYYHALNSLLNYVKEERSASKLFELPILHLFDDMLEGTSTYGEHFIDNSLPYLFSRYYVCLYKNTSIEKEEKGKLIKRIFRHILQLPHYTRIKSDFNKINLVQKIIEEIIKTSIDLKDRLNLRYFLTILSKENYYSGKGIDINKGFIKVAAYMYYLIEKEDLISQEDKKEIKNVVKDSVSILVYCIGNIYDLWRYYNEIQNSMTKWEHFDEDGDVKYIMMDSVIREFFYYLSIATKQFRIDDISEEILDQNEMFIFFSNYTKDSKITDNCIESYTRFKELFNLPTENSVEELINLQFSLMGRYKKLVFDRVRKASNNDKAIKKNEAKIKESLNETLLSNPFFKAIKNKQESSLDRKKIKLLSISMPVEFIVNETNFDFLENNFNLNFDSVVKKMLCKKGFLYEEINYKTTEKIEILNQLVNTYKKSKTKIDTIIYGIKEKSSLMYLETKENLELYRKILKNLKYKEVNKSNEWIGFNNEQLLLNYSEVFVEIVEPTSDQIALELEKVKVEDDFFITITNDISIKFNEDEAKEYLKINKVFINVYMNIEIVINNPGFILAVR